MPSPTATCDQAEGVNLGSRPAAPYSLRLTSRLDIANSGSAKYSIWATSGPPLPALMAVCSLVYSVADWPALTMLTLILGYFCSKIATVLSRLGAQVQKVSVVGVSSAAAGSEVPGLVASEPQAARLRASAAAGTRASSLRREGTMARVMAGLPCCDRGRARRRVG